MTIQTRPEPRTDTSLKCETYRASSGTYISHCGKPAAYAAGRDIKNGQYEGICKVHASAILRSRYPNKTVVYLSDDIVASITVRVGRETKEERARIAKKNAEREAMHATRVARLWEEYVLPWASTLEIEQWRDDETVNKLFIVIHPAHLPADGWDGYRVELTMDEDEPFTVRVVNANVVTPVAAPLLTDAIAFLSEVALLANIDVVPTQHTSSQQA